MQLSSSMTFGHAIRHSLISPNGQMNAFMTHQPLIYDGGMHCPHISNAADGWWQAEHARLFSHRLARVESTLHKLFISPNCW